MIPDVELMTVKQFEEALEGYLITENIPAINYILTRRNFPNSKPFTNSFIASKTGIAKDIVDEIDIIDFKPLYQFFYIFSAIEVLGKIFPTPWTGSYLIEKSALDFDCFSETCLMTKNVTGVISFSLRTEDVSWLVKTTELSHSYCMFRKSDTEIRVDQTGFSEIPKFITLSSLEELSRFHLMMSYITRSAVVSVPFDMNIISTALTDNNPVYEIIKLDNWKVTASLHWSNKFEAFKQKASDLIPKTREGAIKIISDKFKSDITLRGSFDLFMEEYFPKMSLGTVAAYCLINEDVTTEQVEQPA
jgi:hypothetical protein